MRRSRIRHVVVRAWPAARKASADGKLTTGRPTDRKRLSSASRTDASSSTIETTWVSSMTDPTVPGRDTGSHLYVGIALLINGGPRNGPPNPPPFGAPPQSPVAPLNPPPPLPPRQSRVAAR